MIEGSNFCTPFYPFLPLLSRGEGRHLCTRELGGQIWVAPHIAAADCYPSRRHEVIHSCLEMPGWKNRLERQRVGTTMQTRNWSLSYEQTCVPEAVKRLGYTRNGVYNVGGICLTKLTRITSKQRRLRCLGALLEDLSFLRNIKSRGPVPPSTPPPLGFSVIAEAKAVVASLRSP